MELNIIDINTIIVDGITYTAVEHVNCSGCDFNRGKRCPSISCGSATRPDHRSVIWKRKTTDLTMPSSTYNEWAR